MRNLHGCDRAILVKVSELFLHELREALRLVQRHLRGYRGAEGSGQYFATSNRDGWCLASRRRGFIGDGELAANRLGTKMPHGAK